MSEPLGFIRSELKSAIPKLNGSDIEWIVGLIVTERQAAYTAGAADENEACAKEAELHKEVIYGPYGSDFRESEAGKEIAEAIRERQEQTR